jgi:hypothetical protein
MISGAGQLVFYGGLVHFNRILIEKNNDPCRRLAIVMLFRSSVPVLYVRSLALPTVLYATPACKRAPGGRQSVSESMTK